MDCLHRITDSGKPWRLARAAPRRTASAGKSTEAKGCLGYGSVFHQSFPFIIYLFGGGKERCHAFDDSSLRPVPRNVAR